MTTDRKLNIENCKRKVIVNVDRKFADIQRYIIDLNFLDESTKENLIVNCMMCNNSIADAIEEIENFETTGD